MLRRTDTNSGRNKNPGPAFGGQLTMSLKDNRSSRNSQNHLAQLDAFERVRRLFSMIMLPTGAIACLLAWAMELSARRIGALDFYFLPLFALALGVSAVLVWARPVVLPWIERIGFVALSAYLLVTLQAQLHDFLPVYGHLNEFTYWFFVAFLIAFIGWKPRNALYLCAGLYAIMLLLLALNLPPLLKLEDHRFWLTVNYVSQFYFACLIYIAAHYALAQVRPQLSAMQRLALTDPLTGVSNRRRGEELLSLELARASRYGHPLSVILFDLDHFKRVNDVNGHAVGDALLRTVTRVVGEQLRVTDHLARWGGEEFLVIAPELGEVRAVQVAERIRGQIARLRFPGAQETHPTASFGVAFHRSGDTAHSLVQRADEALYTAKDGGRNRVEQEAVQAAGEPAREAPSMGTA
jgi:diguanylate cyclase